MSKKAIEAIIALAIVVSIVTASIITTFQPKTNSNNDSLPTPAPQPTYRAPSTNPTQVINTQQNQSYTGYLVSFNYLTSNTNGVESTQLVFTNKTLNYPGYISLDSDCYYNVIYYSSHPNQALNITRMPSATEIGFMGNAEQISITNVAFLSSKNQIIVTVQNTGAASVTIAIAYINGVKVNSTAPITIPQGANQQITLTQPSPILTSGDAYQVRLTTSKGNNVIYTTTYNK